jgi:hypothetical protein
LLLHFHLHPELQPDIEKTAGIEPLNLKSLSGKRIKDKSFSYSVNYFISGKYNKNASEEKNPQRQIFVNKDVL